MFEFVNVLFKVLVLESLLLATLIIIAGVALLKVVKNKIEDGCKLNMSMLKEVKSEIKESLLLAGRNKNIYTSILVVFGVMKLTAMWSFTILFSVIISADLLTIIAMMLIEILIIAIELNNRIVTKEENKVNLAWLEVRVDKIIQKVNPEFSTKKLVEKFSNTLKDNG